MADFNTTVEVTKSSSDDFILLRHEGRDRKQKRDVFAAGIANARWRNDVNYNKGSIVIASDLQAYVALQASGVDNLQPENPIDNLGKWQLVVNTPAEFYKNVPSDTTVSNGEEFLVNKSGVTKKFNQNTLAASMSNGRWVSTATYKAGSEVTHGTEKYLALVDNSNTTPSFANKDKWFKLKRYVDTTATIHLYTSTLVPEGRLLKANGAALSRSAYPELFAKIGTLYGNGNGTTTFNLPDLRGEFLRFWDDGRGVDANRGLGSKQSDQNKSHTHETTTSLSDTDLGRKTTNTTGNHNHSGTADSAGNHNHTYKAGGGEGHIYDYPAMHARNRGTQNTSTAGAHTHNLSINSNGNHNHYIDMGSHGHALSVTVNNDGGTEVRTRNVALVAYIEY